MHVSLSQNVTANESRCWPSAAPGNTKDLRAHISATTVWLSPQEEEGWVQDGASTAKGWESQRTKVSGWPTPPEACHPGTSRKQGPRHPRTTRHPLELHDHVPHGPRLSKPQTHSLIQTYPPTNSTRRHTCTHIPPFKVQSSSYTYHVNIVVVEIGTSTRSISILLRRSSLEG